MVCMYGWMGKRKGRSMGYNLPINLHWLGVGGGEVLRGLVVVRLVFLLREKKFGGRKRQKISGGGS